jgi:hypothetical protein
MTPKITVPELKTDEEIEAMGRMFSDNRRDTNPLFRGICYAYGNQNMRYHMSPYRDALVVAVEVLDKCRHESVACDALTKIDEILKGMK